MKINITLNYLRCHSITKLEFFKGHVLFRISQGNFMVIIQGKEYYMNKIIKYKIFINIDKCYIG